MIVLKIKLLVMPGENANINGGVVVFVEVTFPTTELSFFPAKGVNDCGFIAFSLPD